MYQPPQPNPKPNYAKPNYPNPSFGAPSKHNYQETLFRGQKPKKAVTASKSEAAPKSSSFSTSSISYKKPADKASEKSSTAEKRPIKQTYQGPNSIENLGFKMT